MRLQCEVCGGQSMSVESMPPSPQEQQALTEFVTEHKKSCHRLETPALITAVRRDTLPARPCGPFGSPKPPPVSTRRPSGHFERTGPYGEQQDGDTLSCCHCRHTWEVRVGSGKIRGFCARCAGYTCGRPECDACIPFEQRLWNREHGLPELTPGSVLCLVPEIKSGNRPVESPPGSDRGAQETGEDPGIGLASGGPGSTGARAEERADSVGAAGGVPGG